MTYMLMPDENTVIAANVSALKPRVFSSNRSFRVLRDAPRARAVIKRHHEDADEDHRRDGADPVEMTGEHAVFGAARRHADHFLGAEIGGEKREPGRPRGNGSAREEEVGAVDHFAPQREANGEHENAVEGEDEDVDRRERHSV